MKINICFFGFHHPFPSLSSAIMIVQHTLTSLNITYLIQEAEFLVFPNGSTSRAHVWHGDGVRPHECLEIYTELVNTVILILVVVIL